MAIQISSSIKEYVDKKAYVNKCFNQIVRDFEMSGLSFEGGIAEESSFEQLIDEVYYNVGLLVEGNTSSFKGLLYRIDLSEKAIQDKMMNSEDAILEEVIAYMIVERCLLKVIFREKYSN